MPANGVDAFDHRKKVSKGVGGGCKATPPNARRRDGYLNVSAERSELDIPTALARARCSR